MPVLAVATFNLYGLPFRQEERAPLVVNGLLELRPDIIGFQEISLPSDRGNWICDHLNERLTGSKDQRYRIYHIANTTRSVTRGAIGIMTRLPVLIHEGLDYLLDLEWNSTAQRIRVTAGDAELDFYNTHFHYLLGPVADEIRCQQADRILRWMDSHGVDVPKVLVGDFNAWPDSKPVRLLKARLRSAYEAAHGSEPPKTWPTPLVNQPGAPDWMLDYIFLTEQVHVLDARVTFDQPQPDDPSLFPSDHYGLTATLEIG